jgi:hypothetical protein
VPIENANETERENAIEIEIITVAVIEIENGIGIANEIVIAIDVITRRLDDNDRHQGVNAHQKDGQVAAVVVVLHRDDLVLL